MPTGNGKIPNFTDSERLKTSRTDCVLEVYKEKNSISLDSRFVDLENGPSHLIRVPPMDDRAIRLP